MLIIVLRLGELFIYTDSKLMPVFAHVCVWGFISVLPEKVERLDQNINISQILKLYNTYSLRQVSLRGTSNFMKYLEVLRFQLCPRMGSGKIPTSYTNIKERFTKHARTFI